MTNYDVIESYAEDFSKFPWNNKKEKYTGTLTPNTLTITNVAVTSALIYTNSKPENFKVYITGIKDNQQVIFGDDTSTYRALIVEKDGVYDVNWEDNHHSYCIWCNFLGDCNITITQLPTSILKDLSGNGNHAYLYGGKGKLNSGMGVYQIDFTSYSKTSVVADVSHNTVKVVPAANGYLFVRYATTEIPAYTVNVQNLGNNVLTYQYATENGRREITLTEGINEIPESIKAERSYQVGFHVSAGTGEITITQIPDYPNQLCYDGKMYAVCYDFPILTDYTVMAERTWFDKTGVKYFLSKYKENESVPAQLFKFEWIVNGKEYSTSLGRDVEVVFPNGITWQTKTSYNGKGLPNSTYEDGDLLLIGKVWLNSTNYFIGCHGAIIIADRSFTEEEINWIKENIYNIKI